MAVLEKEREMEIARRKQEVKLAPLETRLIPVSYADASDIRDRAAPMLSGRLLHSHNRLSPASAA